ncbi:MAG: prolyl oligopeptidase family serine peptidase, partial [Acidobacteriota bacterium]
DWEFRGVPWENPELYEKWSPSNFADRIQTPMLLIHGEHDYRVPLNQTLQLFTVLKRRGVPSRFLYYPDEGHWVLKPQNSRLWYKTLLDWLDSYLKP